jgi:hypothetical protein
MKPETNSSPATSTFDTVASPGKRCPSRRTSSTSKCSIASGSGFSIRARRRVSWRSRCSGGTISSLILRPIASPFVQPKTRSAATFQVLMSPSRSSVTNASGAVSSTSRVRSSELRASRACSCSRPSSREIRRPATSGVPTASSQLTTALSASWMASTTAYATARNTMCADASRRGKK